MLIYDSVYVKSLIVKALAALEPSTNIVNIDVAGCQHWRTLTSSGGVHCSGVPDLHLDGEAVPGDDDALLLVLAERRALPTTIIIYLEIGSGSISSAASTLLTPAS